MRDLLTRHLCEELGPLDPNWFDTLTAQPTPHAVNDPDELCANQEANFKIPFNNSADESQLFSTPKVFRRALRSETEDESEFNAEPGKAFWVAKSPNVCEPTKGDPVLKHGVNVLLQTQDTFNLLQTPRTVETSRTKDISESLGVNVQADISWTSSFNTPPAVPSTLILSNPEESPRPMSLSDEKGVVIVRKLFPSLSNPSRSEAPSPPNAPGERGADDPIQKRQTPPDVDLDHTYCDSKQKSPAVNKEDFCVSENTSNFNSSLRKVKTVKVKRKLIDTAKVQDCVSTLTEEETSEQDVVPKEADEEVPDLKSPLKSQDTQWSPLSLSGIPLGETCRDPESTTQVEKGKLTDTESNSTVMRLKPSLTFTNSGSSKKKRTFIYTVKREATQVEETPTCRADSSQGQDSSAHDVPHHQDEPRCSKVSEGSGEMLPPEPVIRRNLPLSVNVQDFDVSQLNRVFAQDFSQMLSINKQHTAAEDSALNGFSPSLCLTALRLTRQKVRQANLDDCDSGRTTESKANLSYVTNEPSMVDSGFQSVAPDVSLVSNMLSAEDPSQSKMVFFQSLNEGESSRRSEAPSTSEAEKINPRGHSGSRPLSSLPASGFKTASNKGIVISSANLEKAKRLFEETEGERSTLGAQPMDSPSVSEDQRSVFPETSNHLDGKCPLTASQKADVTELCTLLEEAESQFEFTQFQTGNLNQPCADTGTLDKSLDTDFLSGIDFDDSFSSEQEKPVMTDEVNPCEASNMASHQDESRSKDSLLNSERTSGAETRTLLRVSKKCLTEAKALFEDMKQDGCQNSPNKECEGRAVKGDLLEVRELVHPQQSRPTKEVDHSTGFQMASGKGVSVSAKAMEKASVFFKDVDDAACVEPMGTETMKANQFPVNGQPGPSTVKNRPQHKVELDRSEEAISHGHTSSTTQNSACWSMKNFSPCDSVSVGFSTASGRNVSVSASAISKAKSLLDQVQPDDIMNEPLRSDNLMHVHHSGGFMSADEASMLRAEEPKTLLKDRRAVDDRFSAPKTTMSNDISLISVGSVTKMSSDATHVHHSAASRRDSEKANNDSNDFPATEMEGMDEFFSDSEVMDVVDCVSVRDEKRENVDDSEAPINEPSHGISHPPGDLDDDTKRSLSSRIFSGAAAVNNEKLEFEKSNKQLDNTLQHGGFRKASGKSVTVSSAALQRAKSLLNQLDDKPNPDHHDGGTCHNRADPPAEMLSPSTPSMTVDASRFTFSTALGKQVTISEDALTKAKSFLKEVSDEELKQQNNKVLLDVSGVVHRPRFRKPLSPPSSVSTVNAGFATASGRTVTVSGRAMAKAKSLLDETLDSNVELRLNCSVTQGGFHTAGGKGVTFSSAALKKAKSLFSDCDDETKSGDLKTNQERIKDSTSSENKSALNCGFSTAGGKKVSVSHHAMAKASRFLNEGQSQDNQLKHEGGVSPRAGFQTASGKEVSFSSAALAKAKSLFSECDNDASLTANVKVHDEPSVNAGFKAASGRPVGFSAEALQKAKALFDDVSVENTTLVGAKTDVMVVDLDDKHTNKDVNASYCRMSTEDAALLSSSLAKNAPNSSVHGLQNTPTSERSEKSLVVSLNLRGCSETQQQYLAQEALDCTEALLMDESHSGSSMTLENVALREGKVAHEETSCKKRFREEQDIADGQPPLKRRLLEEFDRSVDASRGFDLCPEKCFPTDRRVFQCSRSLQPYVTRPDRDGKHYSESKLDNSSAVDVKSNSAKMLFVPPFINNSKKDLLRNCRSSSVTPAFVPPFKKQTVVHVRPSEAQQEAAEHSGPPLRVKHFPGKTIEMKDPETGPSDVTQTLENIELAQSMQEMRIRKKRRQTIRPQPGSLFTTRTSGVSRVTWKSAMSGKCPGKYTTDQLYECGVAPRVAEITSETAESFRFSLQHFLKQEEFEDDGGVQVADGGWLIPGKDGTAGKEEFYRAMCDTPGVDPKLIDEAWVFNHYRWVVWKLASLERSFPQTMGGSCVTPEQVLLQLKYRYDVEVDNSRRPALRKIMERDDTSAKTLVLCVCGVVSTGRSPSKQRISAIKTAQDTDTDPCAVVWLTDGWYSIKAQLDQPLTAMLHRGRLAVGGKLIINGAQVVGSQEACSPLEAPESLMFKICANSVRPARWDAKLGFYKDPRPFVLPLVSLFHHGGPVGCVDVVVLRIYPVQWMERKPQGTVVFRSARAEEREARRHNTHKQKAMEVLFAKIQADFENEERANRNPQRRARTISRRDLERLQDGEELYETVGDDLEARLSSQQLETLQTYQRSLVEKKQAQLQDKCRRALEESDNKESSCPKRDVTAVWRISVADCVNQAGQAYQLNFWRPSSDLQSSLREGSRYKVFNLTASDGKKRNDFASVQLTNTKKTHIQEVQTSERLLSSCFQPRACVTFSDLQDPEFRSLCGEVDCTGKIISVVDAQGPSPAFYLADLDLNFVKVRCFSSLVESGLAELVKPGVLLALSNLQLRGQSNVPTPVVYSGDLTVFSTNPKETHLRESIERLRSQTQGDFFLKAEKKLSHLIDAPRSISSPALPARVQTPASHSDVKTGLTCPVRSLGAVTPVSRAPASTEKDPRSLKRRRALDYLSRIPSPPPLSHMGPLTSPCVKKTFNPPRRSEVTLRTRRSAPPIKPAPVEDEWVNDEELAMIDTQALHAL